MSGTTRKPRRIVVWAATRAELQELAKRLGWKCRYFAAQNNHGLWMRQPGPKDSFDGEVRCFIPEFTKTLPVTTGWGANKVTENKVVAFAKAGQ